ncbi:MAG: hypothetical protein ABIJ56_15075 [Pseudomonadota bacterium]
MNVRLAIVLFALAALSPACSGGGPPADTGAEEGDLRDDETAGDTMGEEIGEDEEKCEDGEEAADEDPEGVDVAQEDGSDMQSEPGPTLCDFAREPGVEHAADMAGGRYAPLAARLDDGRVLIAGGYDFETGIQTSAELFDPETSGLVETGPLRRGRNFSAVTRLTDGTFLVTGGFHPTYGSLAASEIYDPGEGLFRYSSNMHSTREAHGATLLPDGSVLVTGGLSAVGFAFHQTAELYDPVEGRFVMTGEMADPRAFHAAAYIPSVEKVLVVGGDSGSGELASAGLFDPSTLRFSPSLSHLAHPAKAPTATLLFDGRVLVAGGANAGDGTLGMAMLYDPGADSFEPAAEMNERRMAHAAVRLPDGRVLVSGGWSDSLSPSSSTGSIEVYDPDTGVWEMLGPQLASPRHDHVMILLFDCRVLVIGGQEVLPEAPPIAPAVIEIITIPTG